MGPEVDGDSPVPASKMKNIKIQANNLTNPIKLNN